MTDHDKQMAEIRETLQMAATQTAENTKLIGKVLV